MQNSHGIAFRGLDLSLAPFPATEKSLAYALERLGLDRFGGSGTVFASAFLAHTLSQAKLKRCGFSGLLMPVLEDNILSQRAGQGLVSLNELLTYSAVCGAGLDTIPLPGRTTKRQLASVLLDVCALAVRLNKPLTARLMPIQGKKAGDPVTFDFPYFCDSRVLEIRSRGVKGALSRGPSVNFTPTSS